jgi:ubiquinone/menaquinone biosynthesis C-methylase UbiE
MSTNEIYNDVKNYYSEVLSGKNDLKTSACCVATPPEPEIAEALKLIPGEIHSKFYGCGTPFPPLLKNLTILDLGSGTGRDCYVMSKLAGESGKILGVDMTSTQIAVAEKYREELRIKFGYAKSNVEFRQGYIEDLKTLDIANQSVDLVVSNCVINLSPRKDLVFAELARVLKPGGELYFSDVFVDRRLTVAQQRDPILLGECLGGAMYKEDFRRLMEKTGFTDFRVVSKSPISITDPNVKQMLGNATFESITIRAFRMELEDRCEDYGQVAIYTGKIPNHSLSFKLDDHHIFEANRPMVVCSNTARMLSQSRYAPYFKILGSEDQHFGLFDCTSPSSNQTTNQAGCC